MKIFSCLKKSGIFKHLDGHLILFMEIDQEKISVVIVPLALIQEGQLSVTGEFMCTNYLGDYACPGKVCVG